MSKSYSSMLKENVKIIFFNAELGSNKKKGRAIEKKNCTIPLVFFSSSSSLIEVNRCMRVYVLCPQREKEKRVTTKKLCCWCEQLISSSFLSQIYCSIQVTTERIIIITPFLIESIIAYSRSSFSFVYLYSTVNTSIQASIMILTYTRRFDQTYSDSLIDQR